MALADVPRITSYCMKNTGASDAASRGVPEWLRNGQGRLGLLSQEPKLMVRKYIQSALEKQPGLPPRAPPPHAPRLHSRGDHPPHTPVSPSVPVGPFLTEEQPGLPPRAPPPRRTRRAFTAASFRRGVWRGGENWLKHPPL
jgi:hypothetical protein